DLTIVAALNKIDLPAAEPDRVAGEIEHVLGIPADEILRISAKTGAGVPELLDALVARIPPPKGDADAPLQGLIFDSIYDPYRGVVSSVRVFNGTLGSGARLRFVQAKANHDAEEIGVRLPASTPVAALGPGEVGYLIAGIKDVGQARVGETVTAAANPAAELPGYRDPKPMVFCGLYPVDGDEYANLREALERLRLNDSSFTYEPETSGALGFGFRCGFLGLLHMEIVRERLEREYDLSLVATAPNVEYQIELVDGSVEIVDNPSAMPTPNEIVRIEEPYVNVTVLTPTEYIGSVMELCQQRRGEMTRMEYLSEERVELVYVLPLGEIVMDFFDQLKSRTRGYASLDYEPVGYRQSNLSKVDVLLNNVAVDAFSTIVHRDKAYDYGRRMTEKLRELIPRQLFDVPIQAAVGGRIIARETVKAKRKDVIAKCYGGDITRKRKLLERQKEGKKRMKQIGRVEVPQEAFVAALKLDE
ncbi:MAG TPA: translation elongation factor 4, partial [Acidimicrobiia bacterium]